MTFRGLPSAFPRQVSSGISSVDEYLRTIGALAAVYWLMRLDLPSVVGSDSLDGQRGFSFGERARAAAVRGHALP